ncbi:putative transcriptional regulator [Streptococcus pneumoniae GA47502]|nr:putative transcriptional regulator [Streptococcus pneumoniae GA47502]
MSGALSDMVNTNIYLVSTFEELERYRYYLNGIEYILKTSEM